MTTNLFNYSYLKLIEQAYGNLNSVNWEFYSRVLPIYDHAASLMTTETKMSKQKNVSDCYKILFRYIYF